MNIAYLNDQYLPLDQAHISVLDRGFLFGDSVYEVIPCYSGQPYLLTHHLERLEASLAAIHLVNPLSHREWEALVQNLIEKNGPDNWHIYIQVTRGAGPIRDPVIQADLKPTVFAMCQAMGTIDLESLDNELGVSAVIVPDDRWGHCNIKATNLLPNVLARKQANDAGAGEAVFVKSGELTEGSATNVFIVVEKTDGTPIIKTPPKSSAILGGVTREHIISLASGLQLTVLEEKIPQSELFNCSELWITSSTKGVIPVIQLDQHTIGDGSPGPIWRKIAEAYVYERQQLINKS